jgi:hypothetical protein
MAPGKFHLYVLDKGSGFLRSKVQRQTRLQRYYTLTVPTLLYGTKTWMLKDQQKSSITAEEMTFLRKSAKYTLLDHKRNHSVFKELKIQPVSEKIRNYNSKWIQRASNGVIQTHADYYEISVGRKKEPRTPIKETSGF